MRRTLFCCWRRFRGESDKAAAAFDELKTKYGSSVDGGILAALGRGKPAKDLAAKTTQSAEIALTAYPNPFNPTTRIKFTLGTAGFVTLKVYDLLGREVATLVNQEQAAGPHTLTFDASKLPSGVYFSRLEVGGKSLIQKILLLK